MKNTLSTGPGMEQAFPNVHFEPMIPMISKGNVKIRTGI